jgi:hypothetical protein
MSNSKQTYELIVGIIESELTLITPGAALARIWDCRPRVFFSNNSSALKAFFCLILLGKHFPRLWAAGY